MTLHCLLIWIRYNEKKELLLQLFALSLYGFIFGSESVKIIRICNELVNKVQIFEPKDRFDTTLISYWMFQKCHRCPKLTKKFANQQILGLGGDWMFVESAVSWVIGWNKSSIYKFKLFGWIIFLSVLSKWSKREHLVINRWFGENQHTNEIRESCSCPGMICTETPNSYGLLNVGKT